MRRMEAKLEEGERFASSASASSQPPPTSPPAMRSAKRAWWPSAKWSSHPADQRGKSGEAPLQFLLYKAARSAQSAGEASLPIARLRSMPSYEEYRKRAKEARQEANVCRDEWERQRLLTIADQCEPIAAIQGPHRRFGRGYRTDPRYQKANNGEFATGRYLKSSRSAFRRDPARCAGFVAAQRRQLDGGPIYHRRPHLGPPRQPLRVAKLAAARRRPRRH